MTDKSITLIVRPRGKPIRTLPEDINVSSGDSTEEVYKKIAGAARFDVHRLRVTKSSDGSHVPSAKGLPISHTGLRDRSTVLVKDLGPQIAWRTVFLVEYLGPLLIHPLIYYGRPYLYPWPSIRPTSLPPPSRLQELSLLLVTLHFAKREVETLFVHRFSSATMPAKNIFKNSFHYWIISGLNIAYWTYSPSSPAAATVWKWDDLITRIGIALFAIGELVNLKTHITLRNLRTSSDTTKRGIPQGWEFSLVTCPNYLFETIAWVGIWMVTRSWSTAGFILVAVAQMAAWAKKKERRYRQEFGPSYKKKRYAMIPGIF